MEITLTKDKDGNFSGIVPELAKPEVKQVAELDRNVLGGLTSFKIMKVPVVTPIVAGMESRLVGGLVDAFVAKGVDPKTSWANLGVKFAAAIAVARFTPKFQGNEIAEDAVKFIVYDISKQVLPVESWVDQIVAKIHTTTGAPRRYGAPVAPAAPKGLNPTAINDINNTADPYAGMMKR